MAGIYLPNPVSLLPGADVAVAPAPVTDKYSALAFGLNDSMAKVRDQIKQKRDLDALKAEANAIADYTQDKSPQLADFLRTKANQYNLMSTDIAQERSGLLKGAIDLSRLEQGDRKIAASEQAVKLENVWKNKLNASNKQLDIMMRDQQKWEAEQNDLFMRNESRRAELARQGVSSAPYVKVPYPRQKDIEAIQQQNVQLTEAGPEAIKEMMVP